MTKTFIAIFEHGVLRPLEPIEDINENAEVKVTVSIEKQVAHPLFRFAGSLTEEDANRMLNVIEEEFERVNLDEWKD